MPNTGSARGMKPEEIYHLGYGTNLIGTLSDQGGWVPNSALAVAAANLDRALAQHMANNDLPLLWAFRTVIGGSIIYFGFDTFVAPTAIAGGPNVKIGHVALTNHATISGEIIWKSDIVVGQSANWKIDNNSGAWGAMGNADGKSNQMNFVATEMTRLDPNNISVTAKRAYSRTGWKRAVQQVFR